MDRGRALVLALGAALGEANVTSCIDDGDRDPRTARHVSGRSIGRPLCWVRPTTTEECAAVVRIAGERGVAVCPVGEATTFWDGLRVASAIALDVTSLRTPLDIDAERRLAWVGAGVSLRAIDREARTHGLCLRAYPDTAGDTPAGTLVAVGATAGLGLGRILPIEQVTSATLVLGSGEVVRVGASHALGGPPFARQGLPDLLGLFTAAEGRGALVTQLGLALAPAPFCVFGRLELVTDRGPGLQDLLRLLQVARTAMDRGVLETFRLEVGDIEARRRRRLEVMFRSDSPESARHALEAASRLGSEVEGVLGASVTLEPESDGGRRGERPDHDKRFTVPEGKHRERIEGGAFWGAEVSASWGLEHRECLARTFALYEALASADPHHLRLGVYPSPHAVTIGVHVQGRNESVRVERISSILSSALPDLLSFGVPYRPGNLWRQAMAPRLGPTAQAIERCLAALDPRNVLPGPGHALRDLEVARRRLADAHRDLVDEEGHLVLRIGAARVRLAIDRVDAPLAQVRGQNLSLRYRIEGTLSPLEIEIGRERVRAVAETFLRIERRSGEASAIARSAEDVLGLASEPGASEELSLSRELRGAPERLVETVARLHRASAEGSHEVQINGLAPCLSLSVRPETPGRSVQAACTPLPAPCDECGAAMVCPATELPRGGGPLALRPLRHADDTGAVLAYMTSLARAFGRAVPAAAMDAIVAMTSARAGVLGVLALPFEVSLKRSASELLPRLRVVEYAPRSRPGLPSREERGPLRRERLVAVATALGAAEAVGWSAVVAGLQPPGLELSLGVDIDLEGSLRPQIYAHLEPSDRSAMVGSLEGVLAWSAVDAAARVSAMDVARTSDVVLVAHAPTPSSPRRTKVYFSRRLDDEHPSSGLRRAELGALAPFAPSRGLAVLSCEASGVRWEKWDFQCAAHYQVAEGLASAFAEGLASGERSRVLRLLDGKSFAPWPTWLSVGRSAKTLYLVPR